MRRVPGRVRLVFAAAKHRVSTSVLWATSASGTSGDALASAARTHYTLRGRM